VKYHKGRNKAIKILITKIPTYPYKMEIFPAGIPYSLQKPKNTFCRDFSLRVVSLSILHARVANLSSPKKARSCPKKSQIVVLRY